MKRLTIALAAIVLLCTPSTAQAAFPGFNGRLAFTRTTDTDGATRVVTADADGDGIAALSDHAPASQPAWSADGARVAFVARDSEAPHDLEVFVTSDGGGGTTQITHNSADDLAPAFSPDGTQIVLERLDADPSDGDTSGDLVVITLATKQERFLTRGRDLDTDPAWSRSGLIAFQRDPVGEPSQLMLVAPDGSNLRTRLIGDLSGPDFSPDGALIAYRSGNGIGVVAVDGGPSRAVGVYGRVGDPVFSPDGTKLAVARDSDATDGEIVIADAATGAAETVVKSGAGITDRDPAWQPLGSDAVLLQSGPSGLVGHPRARFEFASVGVEGGYVCRIDGGAFEPCTSPKAYDGLGDGPHRFEVALRRTTGERGPISSRSWTADLVDPQVTFTGGPSGLVGSPDAEFTFAADEEATFACRLDDAPAQDCSSPLKLRGLAGGHHTVMVQATDRVGHTSGWKIRAWDVGETEPPVVKMPLTDCAAGTSPEIKFGKIVARATDRARCLKPYRLDGRDVTVAAGPVSVNGLLLTPGAGELVVFDKAAGNGTVFSTGKVRLQAGPIDAEFEDQISWTGLAATGAVYLSLFDKSEKQAIEEGRKGFKIAGLPLVALPTLEIIPDNGGQTKIGLKLGLPTAVFASLPGGLERGKGISVDFAMTASNDKGVSYQGKLQVAEAWLLGKWKLTEIEASIDTGGPTQPLMFDGSASLEFGSAPTGWAASKFKVGIQLSTDGFLGPLRKLSLQASSLNRPLGTSGIFLQRAGIDFGKRVLAGVEEGYFAGNAGVSLGPELDIKGWFKGSALSLDGKLTVANPLKPELPWRIEGTGEMKLVEIPVSSATVKYIHGRRVEVTGKADMTVGGYGLYSEIAETWFTTEAFNVRATSDVVLPGLIDFRNAQTVISSKGWATCFGPVGLRVGFGKVWGQDFQPLGSGCDVANYSVPKPPDPPATGAQASAAGETRTFDVRGELQVIEARGTTSAPNVTLTGPGGFRLDKPGVRPGAMLIADQERRTTTIVLTRPRAGAYTLTGDAATVRAAGALPTPRIRASVSGGVLRWNASQLAGQTVQFVERGSTGEHLLTTTGKSRGKLRFRPVPGGGARRIEATVLRNGLPRSTTTVARFSAGSTKLGRVRAIKRRGATVRWRRQAAAAQYAVAYSTDTGVSATKTVKGTSLRLPAVLRKQPVTVTIVPLRADDHPGPRTGARLRP